MMPALRSFALAALLAAAALTGAAPAHAATITHAQADAQVAAEATAPQGRIFNGQVSDIRQSPWQVLVYSDDGESLTTCGGSIISPTQVVTAAHCVSDVQNAGLIGADPNGGGGLGVIAGISNYHGAVTLSSWFHSTPTLALTDHEEPRTVSAAIVHPDWAADEAGVDQFPSGDVAVITVSVAFDFTTPAVQPIALPPALSPVDGNPIPVATAVRTVGFGQQVQYDGLGNDVQPSGLLYTQSLSIVDRDVCGDQVDSAVNLCGQTPLGTTCHGDSGSGLVTTDTPPVLVGLVSSGPEPCANGAPTYFASLVTPENLQFVAPPHNLAPPRAPREYSPVVLGHPSAMVVGGLVSCSGGGFSPVSLIKWMLTDETGRLVAGGTGPSLSYTLADADVGHTLSCRAYASNLGGVAVSNLAGGAPKVSAAPVAVVPTPTPQPTPVVTPIPPRKPASFSIAASSTARRGKSITVTVVVSSAPVGADTAIVSVSRIAKSRHAHGSPQSVTTSPKVGDETTTLTLHLHVPRHAQTGRRSAAVKVFVYQLGALVGRTTKTIRFKITR